MSQNKTTLTTPGDREIRTERIFDASRDRLWSALTEPKLLAQWWGRGNPLVVERFELVRGGYYRFVETTPDGTKQGFSGRFREVTPKERIVQSFEWDGMPAHVLIQTMTLEALADGRTKLVTVGLTHTKEERDGMAGSGMEKGMSESYLALDRLLAQ